AGISGRDGPESVAGFRRNRRPDSTGIRSQPQGRGGAPRALEHQHDRRHLRGGAALHAAAGDGESAPAACGGLRVATARVRIGSRGSTGTIADPSVRAAVEAVWSRNGGRAFGATLYGTGRWSRPEFAELLDPEVIELPF